jgi:hypothetical protein
MTVCYYANMAPLTDQPSLPEVSTMKIRTLFSALSDAQARKTGTPAVPMALAATVATVAAASDTNLLAALRNSATDRDQIMQRRIGPLNLEHESLV